MKHLSAVGIAIAIVGGRAALVSTHYARGAGEGLVANQITPRSAPRMQATPVEIAPPTNVSSVDPGAANMGIRFSQVAVGAGAQATLPNGQAALPMTAAVQAAMRETTGAQAGVLRPGVTVTTRYGIFTDTEYGPYAPDGAVIPIYQNRPAWIIRFSGSGVVDTGDEVKPGTNQPTAINHEENIVIDAATGKFLEMYTYR